MAEAGVLARRMPFQVDPVLRGKINEGEVMFIDQHLSETAEQLRSGNLAAVDIAVIEATAITAAGAIIPTMSVGNSAAFAQQAAQVIIEINLSTPLALEGLHDIYIPQNLPGREPIPLTRVDQRLGGTAIAIDPARIAAIVITDSPGQPVERLAARRRNPGDRRPCDRLSGRRSGGRAHGAGAAALAGRHRHHRQRRAARPDRFALPQHDDVLGSAAGQRHRTARLGPAGVCLGLVDHPVGGVHQKLMDNIDHYRSKIVLRPQEISNHPEIVRRLGIIALNTALEFDIYGNVNSTHVCGTHMMNGIGGSGDFARNGQISMFVSKSAAKGGRVSSVVPMVSHVDHTEHDVDVLVTEWGYADLRGLAPRERAPLIIERCTHPDYRAQLRAYYDAACQRGGHTPHLLEQALSWHARYQESGSMLQA